MWRAVYGERDSERKEQASLGLIGLQKNDDDDDGGGGNGQPEFCYHDRIVTVTFEG